MKKKVKYCIEYVRNILVIYKWGIKEWLKKKAVKP